MHCKVPYKPTKQFEFVQLRGFQDVKLGDVWRTCNKIRAAVFRTDLNLWDFFCPYDPNKNGIISRIKIILQGLFSFD